MIKKLANDLVANGIPVLSYKEMDDGNDGHVVISDIITVEIWDVDSLFHLTYKNGDTLFRFNRTDSVEEIVKQYQEKLLPVLEGDENWLGLLKLALDIEEVEKRNY